MFDRLKRRPPRTARPAMTEPQRGTLAVSEVFVPSGEELGSGHVPLSLRGTVSAPGVAPVQVQWEGPCLRRKCPTPGDVLPVTVDAANPAVVDVVWEEVPASVDPPLAAPPQRGLNRLLLRAAVGQDRLARMENTRAFLSENQDLIRRVRSGEGLSPQQLAHLQDQIRVHHLTPTESPTGPDTGAGLGAIPNEIPPDE